MNRVSILLVAGLLMLAGCSGLTGGPKVVEEECVQNAGFTECTVVVENPSDEKMTVNVTATVSGVSESEIVELEAGEQKSVTLLPSIVGDTTYNIDVKEVND